MPLIVQSFVFLNILFTERRKLGIISKTLRRNNMKLNTKRVVNIGFAFLTIMMLWQVYNFAVPLFLEDLLSELLQTGDKIVIGMIMGLDNLFALFMIPLISHMSDKSKNKMGRRVPFVFIGTILSAVTFLAVPFVYNAVSGSHNFWMILLLILNLLLVLISMNIYRSPAVALMPDITPKQLRSKGNSVINIMGGIGAAIGFSACMLFDKKTGAIHLPFIVVTIVMIAALIYFMLTVKEKQYISDMEKELAEYNAKLKRGELAPSEIMPEEDKEAEIEEKVQNSGKGGKLPRHLIFVLLSVFFVYMSVNAVETFMSLYCFNILGDEKIAAVLIAVFAVSGFGFAIPSAHLASKIGRRKLIIIGSAIMAVAYVLVYLLTLLYLNYDFSPYLLTIPFLIAGTGFSFVVINIYPMAVQNCDEKNLGKFTGFYYTASMLAQSITPALSGVVMLSTMLPLMPYAALFMALAFVAILLALPSKKKRENLLSDTKYH